MLSKMQKIMASVILIIGAYVVPLFILNQSQNNSLQLEKIQLGVFAIFFLGAIALTYLNYKNLSVEKSNRLVWFIFEVIGILGILYSGFALCIIYGFSHFGV